jgi:hypothetical protein
MTFRTSEQVFHCPFGASTSGKSADFGSAIPRFESWRPSMYSITGIRFGNHGGSEDA